MKIAIQGILGSFHHLVAANYFTNESTYIECMTFGEIPELLRNGTVDAAIMAIENSNTGSILSNYGLIDRYNLNIQGEVYMSMFHNLMALKGQEISDIKEVWSHPIAIQHCERFFRYHPHIKIIEANDTAFVAKEIREKKLKGIAAIASAKAAEIYDLQILEEQIQTDSFNMTRYFVLTKNRDFNVNVHLHNKASLKFTAVDEQGSLAEILTISAEHGLNLSKIQSMPIANEPWNYAFFIDFTYDDYLKYCNALLKLESKVDNLKILGEYSENIPSLKKQIA